MITTRIGFNLYLSKNWLFFSLVVGEAQNQKQWNFHTWVDSGEASETDKVTKTASLIRIKLQYSAGPYKHKSLLFSPFFLFVNSDQIFILKKLIHNPLLINKTFHQFRCKKKRHFEDWKYRLHNKLHTDQQQCDCVSEDSNFENRALQSPNAA